MSKFTDRLATTNRLTTTGVLVNDPTKVISTISSNTTSGNGLFTAVPNGPLHDPWVPIKKIEERLKKLETDNLFLRLKILSIEGKFTQEEVTNIRKMLISDDASSRALAECIIDNA